MSTQTQDAKDSKSKALQLALAQIEKAYGKESIMRLEENVKKNYAFGHWLGSSHPILVPTAVVIMVASFFIFMHQVLLGGT